MLWASFAAVVLLLSQPTGGMMPFSVKDCSSSSSSRPVLTTSDIRLIPYPVQIPGFVTASGRMVLKRPVGGDLTLEVKMERRVMMIWKHLPCLGNIGSCSYKNLCTSLPHLLSMVKIRAPASARLPLECPLPAGDYILDTSVFMIPEFKGRFSWLAKGDFKLKAMLKDNRTGEELACQQIELTTTSPPRK